MRRTRWALIVVGIVSMLALPSLSSAEVLAPPGHAGANQYFETIPTSAGNAAPPGSVTGSGSANHHAASPIGDARVGSARLSHLGKQGQAAAALAAATAPTPAPGTVSEHGKKATAAAVIRVPDQTGSSSAGALTNALAGSNSGGLGAVLPLLLLTGTIAAVGFGVAKLRGRSASA